MSLMKAKARAEHAQSNGGDEAQLMCVAHNCPNRWTVDNGGGHLCSAHAFRNPVEWPSITAEQQWNETERAQRRNEPRIDKPPLTLPEKKAILHKLQVLINKMRNSPRDPKAWAYALKGMEEEGLHLSEVQKRAWRDALRVPT